MLYLRHPQYRLFAKPLITMITVLVTLLVLSVSSLSYAQAIASPQPIADLSTPRRSLAYFFKFIKLPKEVKGPEQAALVLNPDGIGQEQNAAELAVQLQRILDSIGLVDVENLPDETDYLDPQTKKSRIFIFAQNQYEWIYLAKSADQWLFSAETVSNIPAEYGKRFPYLVDLTLNHLHAGFQYQIPILEIKLWQILGLGVLLVLAFVIGKFTSWLLDKPIRKIVSITRTDWDDTILNAVAKPLGYLVMVGFLSLTFHILLLSSINKIVAPILSFIATIIAVWAAYRLGEEITKKLKKLAENTESQIDDHLIPLVRIFIRVIVISLGIIFLLQSVGVNVAALVAGLGIGGLAVALAAQNILGDLFASVTIALDRPFVIGDFIQVDDVVGSVEYVGLKTTRIRNLTGELLVCSNADLLSSRIRNYRLMLERRIAFKFGVTYQTKYEHLQTIPDMVRKIFSKLEKSRLDRVHFIEFGASSLDFEVVYYVLSSDFLDYRNLQEKINLELFARFAKEGIEFAYPTQTLFIESFPGKEKA